MSRAQLDIAARLRAAHTGTPVPTAAYAPVTPPLGGIAITVDTDGEHTYLNATTDTGHANGTDRAGLDALAALGVTMSAPRHPLIVGTPRDLTVLAALARAFPDADAAPVIGWWDERSDFPGTDAVHVVTAAARLRWTLGVHPDREREVATWARWLGVTTTGAQQLLDLARLTSAGRTLPGVSEAGHTDTASWKRYSDRLTAGRRWWARDTRTDAALGLIARSHAAEWYESVRLSDPLVAVAAAHDGTLVPGIVVARDSGRMTVAADRPLSRLRVDTKIAAWEGDPLDAGAPDAITGVVESTTIDATGQLTITISGIPPRNTALPAGDRATLRPAPVDPHMQANARGLAAAGYKRGTNWIAGHGKPTTRRGNVPLDVIVAAADPA